MKQEGYFAEIRWTDNNGKTGTYGTTMPVHNADQLAESLNKNSDDKTYWVYILRTGEDYG